MTKLAMKIAFEAHKNQVDKSGLPYIYHPVHLAEQMSDENAVCAALLHDVAEDTDITIENLADMGFNEEIIEALKLLNHDDAVPYMDYVKEISKNPVATAVKIVDLKHNSDTTRLDQITQKDLERVDKYKKALKILTDTIR